MIKIPCHQRNMTQKKWMTWVLLVVLLWICPVSTYRRGFCKEIRNYFKSNKLGFIVADDYSGFVNLSQPLPQAETTATQGACEKGRLDSTVCVCPVTGGANYSPSVAARNNLVLLLKKENNPPNGGCKPKPNLQTINGSLLLHLSKWHVKRDLCLCVLHGTQCKDTLQLLLNQTDFPAEDCPCKQWPDNEACRITHLKTKAFCKSSVYNEGYCKNIISSKNNDKYIFNVTASDEFCYSCNNPLKKPEKEITLDGLFETADGMDIDPVKAAEVMNNMSSLAAQLNESSAAVSLGGGVTGVLVKQTASDLEDIEEVSFGYSSLNTSIDISDNRDLVSDSSRSVTIPKEAFEKAYNSTKADIFAALFRFNNMAKDAINSTVLNNEVLAVEMGAEINNLTDDILIHFRNLTEEGTPSCRSWNGKGSRPNWTDDGCKTETDGDSFTCRCSHLTFFAVLMSPPNTTISSADLTSLTYITSIGCGLSIFFLGIVIFMHFLLRKAKANKSTQILIQLVVAMFLLNLTFLTNNSVAQLKSPVGCKIMAAVMHYSMLATFTWFAVEALHLCLQLYMAGKVTVHRYILKVSVITWALPSVVVIVLFILDKYGEQVIDTEAKDVTMCWITDSDVHYIVNIGYYALVFLFTFTTFIVTLRWLFQLKKAETSQLGRHGTSTVTVLGLCCMLGITWGFAFFAHGVLRVPSYYIFTILNSFQGFFLFLYYLKTSQVTAQDGVDSKKSSTISGSSTLNTSLHIYDNPYSNRSAQTNPQMHDK